MKMNYMETLQNYMMIKKELFYENELPEKLQGSKNSVTITL